MATNSIITKVTGTDTSTNRIASTFYGTCSTGASTAAKAVTLSDSCVFNDSCLVTGVTIHVKFTNSNTHATPTLKVGTATAKQIMAYGTTKAGTTATASWYAGSVVSFTYDGTYWIMNDYKIDTDTNTWRDVKLNGTQILGTSTSTGSLNIVPGTYMNITNSSGSVTFEPKETQVTQAQYDALVQAGTVDADTTYFITDGTPTISSDYIKIKMVNPLARDITRNMDMSSYIQLDTGYKFLTWLTNIVPQGFTTDTYLWLADPNLPVGHPYWHTNPIPNSGTTGRLRFFYLEIKNV